MNVRSAGLKFKIATNFIWRFGHGVHHRDSTLPPYGWSNHEVNSEPFFLLDTASRASRCKARRQSPCLVAWNKHGHLEQARTDLCPACSVKVSHLDQTRSDLYPASSVSVRCVVALFPRAKVPIPPPGTELDTSNKHGSICALPTQSKSATSNKREPICAQLALSRLTTSNKLDPSAPCQSGQ